MEANELRSLEEKTRAIVSALSKLESEATRQAEIGDKLDESRNAVLEVSTDLSAVVEKLSDAIGLIKRSALADDFARLDARLDDVKGLSDLAKDEVNKAVEICQTTAELAASAEKAISDTAQRIEAIEQSCLNLGERIEELASSVGGPISDLDKRMESLETIIGRIDRNTQKGIGKERG